MGDNYSNRNSGIKNLPAKEFIEFVFDTIVVFMEESLLVEKSVRAERLISIESSIAKVNPAVPLIWRFTLHHEQKRRS